MFLSCSGPGGSPWQFFFDDKDDWTGETSGSSIPEMRIGEGGETSITPDIARKNIGGVYEEYFDFGKQTFSFGENNQTNFTLHTFGSIKESCLLSIAYLCIPGIFDCIQRWRNIQCLYGNCLIDTVSAYMDPVICAEQKDYLECMFIFGEIFKAMPWVSFIRELYAQIISIIDDPIGILFAGVEVYCGQYFGNTVPHKMCHYYKLGKMVIGLIESLKQIFENFSSMFDTSSSDYCDSFLDKAETFLDGEKKEFLKSTEGSESQSGEQQQQTTQQTTNQTS
jgi:hypothetical protein